MTVAIRPARSGDGAGISRAWLSAAAYYADRTRLEVASLIVDRGHWRSGAGTALLEAAEAWGRARGAQVARLDTYVHSPVSVPFYEEHMGYQRRAIVFQKRL